MWLDPHAVLYFRQRRNSKTGCHVSTHAAFVGVGSNYSAEPQHAIMAGFADEW
jgi:hypothetical protein